MSGIETDQARRQKEKYYHPELDKLRLVAFLMVFAWHAIPSQVTTYEKLGLTSVVANLIAGSLAAGAYGVDLFFALSSYLITTLLLREQSTLGKIDVESFYVRRILRIWPLYFFAVMVIPWGMHQLDPKVTFPSWYLVGFVLFCGNWCCAIRGFPAGTISQLWSVSIEEQFYLAWPFVLRLARGRIREVCYGLIAVSWITRLGLAYWHAPFPAAWCCTFSRLDPIALGALLAVWERDRQPVLSTAARWALIGLGAALLVTIGCFCDIRDASAIVAYPTAGLASLFLIWGTLRPADDRPPGRVDRVLIHGGRISYGLYVFHVSALYLTRTMSPSAVAWVLADIKGLVITCIMAALSYRFIEAPFLNLKKRFTYVASAPDPNPALFPAPHLHGLTGLGQAAK